MRAEASAVFGAAADGISSWRMSERSVGCPASPGQPLWRTSIESKTTSRVGKRGTGENFFAFGPGAGREAGLVAGGRPFGAGFGGDLLEGE
jgi:hypothetical protein